MLHSTLMKIRTTVHYLCSIFRKHLLCTCACPKCSSSYCPEFPQNLHIQTSQCSTCRTYHTPICLVENVSLNGGVLFYTEMYIKRKNKNKQININRTEQMHQCCLSTACLLKVKLNLRKARLTHTTALRFQLNFYRSA